MEFGIDYLSKMITDDDVEAFIKMNPSPEYFIGDDSDLFEFVSGFVGRYGKLPTRDTVAEETNIEVTDPPEPAQYYLDHLERQYIHNEVRDTLMESSTALKEKDPEEALAIISKAAMDITTVRWHNSMIDYRKAKKPIFDTYATKYELGDQYGARMGWHTFDRQTSGLIAGDTVAIVGRPSMGKTFLEVYAAHHVWSKQQKTPLMISMEMEVIDIVQRITAIDAGVSAKRLRDAQLDTRIHELTRTKDALIAASESDTPFWIVDGNMAATVNDVVMLCRHLKPDILFIDGAYLMESDDPRANNWQKVKGNIEGIHRRISKGLGIPSVLSYQFSRETEKLKKGQTAGLEHIGLSDAVGQVASIVLGLFEEESVETMLKRRVNILKGRHGQVGQFFINWDFNRTDFREFTPKKLNELDYK